MSGSTDVVRARLGARDLWGLIRPARRALKLGCLVAVATALASLVQPLIARALLEDIDAGGSVAAGTVALLVVMLVVETVLWGVGIYVAGRAASGLLRSVRVRLAARLLRLRIVEHDLVRSDDLVSRLSNDTARLGEALTSALMAIVPGGVLIVGSIAFMAVLDPLLLCVTLAAVVVAAGLLWWLSPKVQEASETAQEAVGELAVEAGRALRPLRTVKAARAEQRVAACLQTRADEAYARSLRVAWLEALITPGTAMAFQAAYVLILAVGGARVASGDLSVPDFVAFLLYLFALTDPLNFTFAGVVDLQKGLGAARRVTDASRRDIEPTGPRTDSAPAASTRPVKVRFEAVSFSYRKERAVLREVTVNVPAGSLTAIVGASGAGKTTMLALLERFYQPDSGRILLDALDIQDIALAEVRAQIGYVEQDAPVLDGSVRDNVLLTQPDATPDALARAIAEAGLEPVLDTLPEGLATEVGEAGVLLSGGQRQRIAIARALLADPPLLLLDEPTSQLDALTDAELRASLDQLRGRRTVIVVAHRLATVVGADQILVLEDGRVRATGTHSHLVEHDSLYRSLCRAQNLDASEQQTRR